MKLFKLLSLGSILAIAGFGQTLSVWNDAPDYAQVTKTLKIPGHVYVVYFTYNRSRPWITAALTNTIDLTRCESYYSAVALVSEIVNGEERNIGDSISTYFEEGRCWRENALIDLVENQLKSTMTLLPSISVAFQKLRDDAAYAAQKPFEQNGHVLNVTRRGVKEEINEVQIDGVVVWKNPKPISEPEHGLMYGGSLGTVSSGIESGDSEMTFFEIVYLSLITFAMVCAVFCFSEFFWHSPKTDRRRI